jgi:hypothetical protein
MTPNDIKDLYNLAILLNSVSHWIQDESSDQPPDEATRAIAAVRTEAKELLIAANTFLEG